MFDMLKDMSVDFDCNVQPNKPHFFVQPNKPHFFQISFPLKPSYDKTFSRVLLQTMYIDPGEIPHNATFNQKLPYLLRLKRSTEKESQI